MKRLLSFMVVALFSLTVKATPLDDLQKQLAGWQGFSADFQQTVTGADGQVLQQAKGSMDLERPGRFKWHTAEPDEQWVVADGKALWMYDPFVEQVTVYALDKALANTPFLLLASDDKRDWSDYQVVEKDTGYRITPTNKNVNLQWFELAFSAHQLQSLTLKDAQGQTSAFRFSGFKLNPEFSSSYFSFDVPDGADIDDQR